MSEDRFDFEALDDIEIDMPEMACEEVEEEERRPVLPLVSVVEEVELPEPIDIKREVRLLKGDPHKLFDFRKTKLNPLQQLYIVEFAVKGTKAGAAVAAGVPISVVNTWMKDDVFRDCLQNATDIVADSIEEEAIRRAMEGSDKLLALLLKGHKPEKYAEKRVLDAHMTGEVVHSWADLAKRASLPDGAEISTEDYEVKEEE